MSEDTILLINGKIVHEFSEYHLGELLDLFDASSVASLSKSEAREYLLANDIDEDNIHEYIDTEIFIIGCTAKSLKDRLKIRGFNNELCRRVFSELINEKITRIESIRGNDWVKSKHLPILEDKIHELQELKYGYFLEILQKHLNDEVYEAKFLTHKNETPISFINDVDDRIKLYIISEILDDDTLVEFDVSYSASEGYIDDEKSENGQELSHVAFSLSNQPPILITEGKFDKYVIEKAISILRPDLKDSFRFLDYSYKNKGGASVVLDMIKNFAAAGIEHRILVILDNDSAAYDSVLAFSTQTPSNYAISHYPDIDLAKRYPTTGAQGSTTMNVNKLAGSVELYLGEDCLTDTQTNSLSPVEWGGLMGKVKTHQGEVSGKSTIQKRFRAKVAKIESGKPLVERDWRELHVLIDSIINDLSSIR